MTLESGESLSAQGIIVATEGPATGELLPLLTPPPYRPVANLYFAAPEPPFTGPYLLLNGEGVGRINNLCILSQVAPTYSKNFQQLLSVSVLNPVSNPNRVSSHRCENNYKIGLALKCKNGRTYTRTPSSGPTPTSAALPKPLRFSVASSEWHFCLWRFLHDRHH